jgi:hypothetical protein
MSSNAKVIAVASAVGVIGIGMCLASKWASTKSSTVAERSVTAQLVLKARKSLAESKKVADPYRALEHAYNAKAAASAAASITSPDEMSRVAGTDYDGLVADIADAIDSADAVMRTRATRSASSSLSAWSSNSVTDRTARKRRRRKRKRKHQRTEVSDSGRDSVNVRSSDQKRSTDSKPVDRNNQNDDGNSIDMASVNPLLQRPLNVGHRSYRR